MGVYATEGKLLAYVVACLLEGVVGEAPIVAVIVLDPNPVRGSEGPKGVFGDYGLDR